MRSGDLRDDDRRQTQPIALPLAHAHGVVTTKSGKVNDFKARVLHHTQLHSRGYFHQKGGGTKSPTLGKNLDKNSLPPPYLALGES